MPDGLKGAPAKLSRLMDKVLDGLISKNCLVYLEHFIIFGRSFEETLANLKLVMGRLRDHNLLCKARKCELFETSIAFLGQVMAEEGIATDPGKGRENMQLIRTERQIGYEKHIGIWKLLQVVHQELLCNNSPSTRIVEKVCPLQVWRRTRASLH